MMKAHKVIVAVRAECSCGWRSPKEYRGVSAETTALIEWSRHARECNQ